ncbi:MAG: hypothetical protein CMJ78_15525 [Planctomycetaceae bacterium]|nr:hypothetical protein [Planctomycetaceae bacterium]
MSGESSIDGNLQVITSDKAVGRTIEVLSFSCRCFRSGAKTVSQYLLGNQDTADARFDRLNLAVVWNS